jgi:hypothetical protein
LLIFFGIAVIVLGVWGFAFTRDHIEREGHHFRADRRPGGRRTCRAVGRRAG